VSAPKFTPGTWRIKYADKRRKVLACYVIDAEYRSVCSFFGSREQATANAQLCSAAPDLYAALKSVIEWHETSDYSHGKDWFDVVEQARSALGKAVVK